MISNLSLGFGPTVQGIKQANQNSDGHFSSNSELRTANLAFRVATFAGAIIAIVGGSLGAASAIIAGATFGAVMAPILFGAVAFFVLREGNVLARNIEDIWFNKGNWQTVKEAVNSTARWNSLIKDTYFLKYLPPLV